MNQTRKKSPGAPTKPDDLKKKPVTFRFSPKTVKLLDQIEGNKTRFLENLIQDFFNNPPVPAPAGAFQLRRNSAVANHPHRNWRSRWTVDLAACTATHQDGWTFQFADLGTGEHDGKCTQQPNPLTSDHLTNAARIAREAGDIFVETRRKQAD